MKKVILAIAAAFLLIVPFQSASAQTDLISALTGSNGNSAGSALLGLYTQYKADGKLDLTNAKNITNLVTLANNVKGLKGNKSAVSELTPFISGLISGSKNLVNKDNSNSVLNTLKSVSNLDLSSLGNAAASAAVNKAKSGLLSKITGKSSSSTSSADNQAALQAGKLLTGLFQNL